MAWALSPFVGRVCVGNVLADQDSLPSIWHSVIPLNKSHQYHPSHIAVQRSACAIYSVKQHRITLLTYVAYVIMCLGYCRCVSTEWRKMLQVIHPWSRGREQQCSWPSSFVATTVSSTSKRSWQICLAVLYQSAGLRQMSCTFLYSTSLF